MEICAEMDKLTPESKTVAAITEPSFSFYDGIKHRKDNHLYDRRKS